MADFLSSTTAALTEKPGLFPQPAEPASEPQAPARPAPPPFDADGAWRKYYRNANAPVSQIERFAAFRALHPQQSVEDGGLTWRYRVSGAGQPLLLLPGRLGASDFAWRLIELLERQYRVLALDYPAVENADALVRGVCAVLAAEGLSAVTLIGSGFGGLAAQRFADRRPEQTLALALLNAPAPTPRLASRMRRRARLLQALPRRWAQGLQRRRFEQLLAFPPEERQFWRGYTEEAFCDLRPTGVGISLLRTQADLHGIGGDSPSGFHRPVLIVEAEGDQSAPQYVLRQLPARFPQAERRCFSYGAGHTVEVTRAREVAHAVRQLQSRI